MRKIAIMTGTRADYGLLRPLIAAVDASREAELQLIVTGTHLSAQHGKTIDEIVRDGFTPAAEVDIWGEELTQALTGEPGSQALTAAVETGEAMVQLNVVGVFGTSFSKVVQVASLFMEYSTFKFSLVFSVVHFICCVVPFPQISPPLGLITFTYTSLNAYIE